ncbi:uncharacterized protein LOC111377318 [Olea europaea var. sylvestris]|uniref:uncharacterized protein LOC111377318 n=1 Tax=Olea europaea var. sylvestris TaxID=158386 RepID=UPI000C1D1728|nr:uncharacterized protein LOC111377318 [Olea europaea var. sylvestris]
MASKIISLCRNFLWGSKKSLVAWNQICLPKHEEGLGFRNIKSWNVALLSKTLWNIHSRKDTLWIKWINQRLHYWAGMCRAGCCEQITMLDGSWQIQHYGCLQEFRPDYKRWIDCNTNSSTKTALFVDERRKQYNTCSFHVQLARQFGIKSWVVGY